MKTRTLMTDRQYQKKYNVRPAGRHETIANPRFRDPVHFQINNPGWLVCQGFVKTEEGSVAHSWVEYGGIALDLYYNYRMPISLYYQTHHVSSVQKFTKAQCRKLMDNTRRYGPWTSKDVA